MFQVNLTKYSNSLDISKLELPWDVISQSGTSIPLFGTITGSKDEIIVMEQYRRNIYCAQVCHLEKIPEGFSDNYKITDLYGYPDMIIKNNYVFNNEYVKSIGSIIYTMVCISDRNNHECCYPNWLF